MAMNERISELILEIEFGMNMIDVKRDCKGENTILCTNKMEQKSNDNLQRLEKVFFENISNEIYG